MKSFLFLFAVLSTLSLSAQNLYKNLIPLSNWDNDSLPSSNIGAYNDVWGYSDDFGNEYAILGSMIGTHFILVTDPSNPQQISFFPGADSIGLHRDFKTYGHYAYGVSDEGSATLQIFDLSNLPLSVEKVYDSNEIVSTCHNIFIDQGKIYFAGARDQNGFGYTLLVASLLDPENPVVLDTLTSTLFPYVHDVFARNDTAYLSCGTSGLFIYNYADSINPLLLQTFTSYPQKGYNHSNWVSEDGKTLVFADETHGSGLKVYDISNLDNPVLLSLLRSNLLQINDSMGPDGSIPHNPFVIENQVFISYYHDGVQVFDITNPNAPINSGYYDTETQNISYEGYNGCWGVYPFLPSNNILASDVHNGLFVLDGSALLSVPSTLNSSINKSKLFPNPAYNEFYFSNNSQKAENVQLQVFDLSGKLVLTKSIHVSSGNTLIQMDCNSLSPGMYIVKTLQQKQSNFEKLIIAR